MFMRDAKKGLTSEIRDVAKLEGVDAECLRSLVAAGFVAIPKNISRNFPGRAVGKLMSTKINANVGTSKDYDNPAEEIEKANVAVEYGADAVMDLSTGQDNNAVRKQLTRELTCSAGHRPHLPRGAEAQHGGRHDVRRHLQLAAGAR